VLFRDASEPFPPALLDVAAAIGPPLGQRLAKVIRIHHRHLPDFDDDAEDFGYDAPA
jgi:hypothetical protein